MHLTQAAVDNQHEGAQAVSITVHHGDVGDPAQVGAAAVERTAAPEPALT